ncbi:MAG: hypothetical protein JW729_10435, partial [Bacteroidales bacterium]|nr:hypothetical protein [Bacteroidales bacterium]
MEKHILSKSTFIKGHQCLKALYLHKKRPFLRDKMSAEQRAKFKRGHDVGFLAQELFPGGIDVSPKSPSQYQKSVEQTQELIAEGQTIIYEATFQFNKVLVMLDILVKTDTGWEAYEVKSSLGLSETYFTDAALQYYVISNSGLTLEAFYLVHVDPDYNLGQEGKIDVQSYFQKVEVSAEILNKQKQIAKEVEVELQILNDAHSPKVEVGAHCFSPYPCDFQGFCWKGKATDLFKLPALSEEKRNQLLSKGILSKEALLSEIDENPLAQKQLDSLNRNSSFISNQFKEKVSALPEKTAYLSFVSRKPAIPSCVGNKPYQEQLFVYAVLANNALESQLYSGVCDEYELFINQLFIKLIDFDKIIVFDQESILPILDDAFLRYANLSHSKDEFQRKIAGIKQAVLEGDFYSVGLKYDLQFKDVVKQTLNIFPYAKQPIYADVLAVNLFEQLAE